MTLSAIFGLNLICYFFILPYCHVSFLQPCGHLLGKGRPLGYLFRGVFFCLFDTFLYGVLGQEWYLIELIP